MSNATPTISIFECRSCGRQLQALNSDDSILVKGWRLIDNIDGPNVVCDRCVADDTRWREFAESMAEDGYEDMSLRPLPTMLPVDDAGSGGMLFDRYSEPSQDPPVADRMLVIGASRRTAGELSAAVMADPEYLAARGEMAMAVQAQLAAAREVEAIKLDIARLHEAMELAREAELRALKAKDAALNTLTRVSVQAFNRLKDGG